MLKGLFKQLDPSVMKATGEVRGEVQLSYKYDFKRHLLLVKVIKCRELRSKDLRSKMSDPYVKVFQILNEFLNEKNKILSHFIESRL